jgi:PIN domain nuclease of toxin-antitoxin system
VILLDTHVALWFVTGSSSIGRHSRRIVRQAAADSQLAVSAVSFWEVVLLLAKRRLRSSDSAAQMRQSVLNTGAIELPLTGEIAILAGELEGLHADPADRFIAATAILSGAALVTADERLLRWRHPLRRQNAEN